MTSPFHEDECSVRPTFPRPLEDQIEPLGFHDVVFCVVVVLSFIVVAWLLYALVGA